MQIFTRIRMPLLITFIYVMLALIIFGMNNKITFLSEDSQKLLSSGPELSVQDFDIADNKLYLLTDSTEIHVYDQNQVLVAAYKFSTSGASRIRIIDDKIYIYIIRGSKVIIIDQEGYIKNEYHMEDNDWLKLDNSVFSDPKNPSPKFSEYHSAYDYIRVGDYKYILENNFGYFYIIKEDSSNQTEVIYEMNNKDYLLKIFMTYPPIIIVSWIVIVIILYFKKEKKQARNSKE